MNRAVAGNESVAALRREIVDACSGLFICMAARCTSCVTHRSRCPDCTTYAAKRLLERIRRLRALERGATASLLPPVSSLPTRRSRIRHIVGQLRRAARPLPAAGIAVPGVKHPKSILKLLRIAAAAGLLQRVRGRDPETGRTCYLYSTPKHRPAK